MRAIMESVFSAAYLVTVISLGVLIVRRAGGDRQRRLFGIMALVLGFGDAFHLVPRIYALLTDGLESHAAALGFGTLVTSITMTAFYALLYVFWKARHGISGRHALDTTICVLVVARVALCFMPHNQWLSAESPLAWGIYRNVPFAILGALMTVFCYRIAKENGDRAFRHLWLAIALSFAFYIPVVLFAGAYPWVGALMIPKTCAYVWIVWMGFRA